MPRVWCEGGYRDVDEAYVVCLPADDVHKDAGLIEDLWTLFDMDGVKIMCSANRSTVFHWATNNEIKIVMRQ